MFVCPIKVINSVTQVPKYQYSIHPTKNHYGQNYGHYGQKQNQAQRFPEEGQEYQKFGISSKMHNLP